MKPIQQNDIWDLLGAKQEDLFFKVYPELIKTVTEVRMEKVRCLNCKENSRDELAMRNESSGSSQEEIKDERKLLAILLEREAARINKLVEVG